MEAKPRIRSADGISRLLGVVAMLIAAGSSWFLYQDNNRLRSEMSSLRENAENPEEFSSFAGKWDRKLTSALTKFDEVADAATKKFDEARLARNRLMKSAVSQSELTKTDVERMIRSQVSDLQIAAGSPDLQLPTLVMRPRAEILDSRPTVRNVGTMDAEIKVARFLPKNGSQFEVEDSVAVGENRIVIQYDPSHNQDVTVKGAHRFYERTYEIPEVVIPSDSSVEVSIEIRANGRHLDWGLRGDLELEYQGQKRIVIPNARAIFVADEEKTI